MYFLIGKRNTKQKKHILDCLKDNLSEHLTTLDIENILKKRQTPVGTATVYRCINLLVKEGLVRKYKIPEKNSSCYQYIDPEKSCTEHFHFICSNCRQTIHFEDQDLFSFLSGLNLNKNYFIDVPKTIFYGLCKDCKAAC